MIITKLNTSLHKYEAQLNWAFHIRTWQIRYVHWPEKACTILIHWNINFKCKCFNRITCFKVKNDLKRVIWLKHFIHKYMVNALGIFSKVECYMYIDSKYIFLRTSYQKEEITYITSISWFNFFYTVITYFPQTFIWEQQIV